MPPRQKNVLSIRTYWTNVFPSFIFWHTLFLVGTTGSEVFIASCFSFLPTLKVTTFPFVTQLKRLSIQSVSFSGQRRLSKWGWNLCVWLWSTLWVSGWDNLHFCHFLSQKALPPYLSSAISLTPLSLSLSVSPFLCLVLHPSSCACSFLPLLQQIFP